MESINVRISKVVQNSGLSKTAFGKKINVSQQHISKLTKDGTPSDRTITDICREFNISEEWLRTGKGDMSIEPDAELFNLIDKMMRGENEFAKSLFKAFAKLDENQWKVVQQIVEDVANNQKEDK